MRLRHRRADSGADPSANYAQHSSSGSRADGVDAEGLPAAVRPAGGADDCACCAANRQANQRRAAASPRAHAGTRATSSLR